MGFILDKNVMDRVPDVRRTRWVFLRMLAVVIFLAFYSLNVQILGLVGEDGIVPIAQALGNASVNSGWEGFWQLPTLAWWYSSDTALLTMSWIGMFLSLLLFFDCFPKAVLLLLWLLYLSLLLAGQLFTSYQWDSLITEVLLASVFFAPATVLPGSARGGPTRASRFLLTLVLFKLMFLGGFAKLESGDMTWWNLTALDYHFWTQPIPTPPAWFVDKLPPAVLTVGVIFTLVVELIVPFFLFLGRRWKIGAALGIILFQGIVAATGNYGIFNALTAVLCLVVLDDQFLKSWIPTSLLDGFRSGFNLSPPASNRRSVITWSESLLVGYLVFVNLIVVLGSVGVPMKWEPVRSLRSVVTSFRSVNSYGLFANMTTERKEIIVQGSNDGFSWSSYRFPYKPGEPTESPPVVAPHMPRLDWQMWFAALKPPNRVPWFPHFLRRLLQGSDSVLRLMAHNPFPDEPPRYIRAISYDYEFTGWRSWWRKGRWWKRSNRQLYYPPLTLQDGKLRRVNSQP